jgi:uncharacterized protein YkwD
MRSLAYLFLVFFLFGCGGSNDILEKANVEPVEAPDISSSLKKEYLDAINRARKEEQDCGVYGKLGPVDDLSWSDNLYNAAYEHSYDMAKNELLEHDGSGKKSDHSANVLHPGVGSTFDERAKVNGYDFSALGENIAYGQNSTQEVIDGWLESDGHCKNLMSSNFKEVGMAMVKSSDGVRYWTQVFGSK